MYQTNSAHRNDHCGSPNSRQTSSSSPHSSFGPFTEVTTLGSRELPKGLECLVCYDDLTPDNFALYRTNADSLWYPAFFCLECIEELRKSLFPRYVDSLTNTKCAREQRALLERGPPVNLFDKNGFPQAGDAEIHQLFDLAAKRLRSAKLEGSLTGKERLSFWEEQKKFVIIGEKEDGDEGGREGRQQTQLAET